MAYDISHWLCPYSMKCPRVKVHWSARHALVRHPASSWLTVDDVHISLNKAQEHVYAGQDSGLCPHLPHPPPHRDVFQYPLIAQLSLTVPVLRMGVPVDAVPPVPNGLSVRKEDFMDHDFSVDKFLTRWHSSASVASNGPPRSLEALRDDLGIYLKVLRSSMIELINEDYADFVSLSTKLVGLDESLKLLAGPLLDYKDEVGASRQSLTETLASLHETLKRREHVHAQKSALQNLEHIISTLNKVERLLGLSGLEAGEVELSGDLVERVAAEINYLNFCVSKCQASSFVEQMQPRLKVIGDRLHGSLESQWLEAVAQQNTEVLKRCLRIFATVDQVREAETMVRNRVIRPYLEDIITEEFVGQDPLGLQGMYHRVLRVIPEKLSTLLQLTSGLKKRSKSANHDKDFDFLVNSLWPEIVEKIEENIAFIFSAGNPDKFFAHYTSSLEFVERFEKELGNARALEKFRDCPAYASFFSKWNLPVYFQIRFQEIAFPVETSLAKMFNPNPDGDFRLASTQLAFNAIKRCWADSLFLNALAHRFWKLTLQIVSRFGTAILAAPDLTFEVPIEESLRSSVSSVSLMETYKRGHSRSSSDQGAKIKTLAYRTKTGEIIGLYQDVTELADQMQSRLFPNVILPKFSNLPPQQLECLTEAINEGCEALRARLPFLSDIITKNILDKALPYLKQVADIPRLYRRTNREIPSKPCTYLIALLDPISNFNAIELASCPSTISRAWKCSIFNVVSEQFLKHVSEVLAAVQKMEESLKRLKRVRDSRTSVVGASEEDGRVTVSDDDKIRLQLYVDVMYYVKKIQLEHGLNPDEVNHTQELVQLVDESTKAMLSIRQEAQ